MTGRWTEGVEINMLSSIAPRVIGISQNFPKGVKGHNIKQPSSLAMGIKPAVENLIGFPLVGVVQPDWWWWVYGSVGDLTRASGLQQCHMENWMDM